MNRRLSTELIGEMILLLMAGALFIYLFVSSLNWTRGDALMPQIISVVGMLFVLIRAASLLRERSEDGDRIMDVGFLGIAEGVGQLRRFGRIVAFLVLLYLAIWVFGFHIALPLGLFLYVLIYSRIGWIGSILFGLFFYLYIVGIYDHVIHVRWHEPLIYQIWK